jgi:mRNA interferase HigB
MQKFPKREPPPIGLTKETSRRMHVIARRTLRNFWDTHPDAEQALEAWYHEARSAQWLNTADVKRQYGKASIVGRNRVVFNICGNKYRLIVHVNYAFQKIFIRFIGTHAEYGGVNAETI